MEVGRARCRRVRPRGAGLHAGAVPAARRAAQRAGIRRADGVSGAAAVRRGRGHRGSVAPAAAADGGDVRGPRGPRRLRRAVDGLEPRVPRRHAPSRHGRDADVLAAGAAARMGRGELAPGGQPVAPLRPPVRGVAAAGPARHGRGHVRGRRLHRDRRPPPAAGPPAAARAVRPGAGVRRGAPDPATARSRPPRGAARKWR